ncbi:hypothetical protein P3X46_003299 [Hevea brasiliensis]|uniref:Pop1 N-terminal domain-containing protein n=1 Tax=Hevea brasiliensis TaxID=3981 RepID=A0ABQ9N9K9_HEVBR|nr:ribonucleases P/MRP protein subunit POP1 isoform X2 [Hevea brasiliensis]KAJ9187885.1 hypothetical protein P3X46_003299 [Hevea brasiliensis]
MAGHGSKRSEISAIPPRKINVEKFVQSRASELEALHSIVSDRLSNDFRSRRNKRRRTTAYDNQVAKKRYKKRRKLGVVVDKSNAVASEQNHERVPPRRVRRRLDLRKNSERGFSTSGEGMKRLRTHVWHAKRFTMTKLWGFHLPLGLHGRGRGSRALLKWYKHGALVHDASYYTAVQLEGPEDSLTSILRMVLEPPSSAQSEEITNAILSGFIYGTAMLHHVGAPVSQLIAPVTYMWRPYHLWNGENGGSDRNSYGCNELQSSELCSSHRQLWVWIHASAFSEGYDALKFACQKHMNESGILINCFSLEGQLAKLEVIGSKAFQLLQKILHPVYCDSKNSWQPKECVVEEADHSSELKNSSILENEENISSCSIFYLTVRDPRAMPETKMADVPVAAASTINYLPENEPGKDVTIQGNPEKNKELILLPCSKPERDSSLSDKRDLWDASCRVSLPVEENVLCLEKHHLRMDFVCLDNAKSGMLSTSTKVQGSRSSPIVLLKLNNGMDSFMGWSIIIPLCWVKVFWMAFISKGAHAIGLREKRWIACEVGLPFFPSDFPDCNAYLSSMASESAALNQKAEQVCPAVRPLKVPVPPPWNSVRVAVTKGCIAVQVASSSCAKDIIGCNSSSNSRCDNSDITSLRVDGNSFDGIIARTSSSLDDFLNEIHDDCSLLFPQAPNRKMRFLEFINDESKLVQLQNGITQMNCDRKLCFVRVLLHAYKKGVFEEGAIVCAPCLSDVSLLTSRSENNETGLQIPVSLVRSYFKEQSSGKWELQIPEDSAARESHRWPIGFVTTGFVRGSKKPVAEAFCEAVLLARLREEQWNEIPVKQRRKEIYVLVRNLRSSAYRLAMATIVLEQQEDDMEFV